MTLSKFPINSSISRTTLSGLTIKISISLISKETCSSKKSFPLISTTKQALTSFRKYFNVNVENKAADERNCEAIFDVLFGWH